MLPPPHGSKRTTSSHSPSDIPIVHALYDAYAYWNGLLEKYPKSQRHTLGDICSRYLLTTLELILEGATNANSNEKIIGLRKASVKLDILKLLVRLSKDCHCISNASYLQMESRLQDVGRMLGGWIHSLRQMRPRPYEAGS
ncbi:four helix bundle protein [Patescibacteria group bacterium]|nr:four helix bundle protein [Patescibacteria group bacterium]MBU1448426.1 four helix bundle protein [Patescibacteria group bacterium]MBU2613170.1 four helix bundle protein [Patescibacteria group bacterium]